MEISYFGSQGERSAVELLIGADAYRRRTIRALERYGATVLRSGSCSCATCALGSCVHRRTSLSTFPGRYSLGCVVRHRHRRWVYLGSRSVRAFLRCWRYFGFSLASHCLSFYTCHLWPCWGSAIPVGLYQIPRSNPALNRTCAKSRAVRLAPRWAS